MTRCDSAPDECIITFPFRTWEGAELPEQGNAASTNGAFRQNSDIRNSQQATSPEVRISTSRSIDADWKTLARFFSSSFGLASRNTPPPDAHILFCCSQTLVHCAATSQGRLTRLPSQEERITEACFRSIFRWRLAHKAACTLVQGQTRVQKIYYPAFLKAWSWTNATRWRVNPASVLSTLGSTIKTIHHRGTSCKKDIKLTPRKCIPR